MQQTKIKIAESLLELLEESELHEIQMTEIAEHAMVSDRTIRRYFKGKESIIRFYINYLNSSLDFSDVDTVYAAVLKYISLWINEGELVELLKKRDVLYLLWVANMEYAKNSLQKVYDELYADEKHEGSKDYIIDLIVSMEVSLFRTWIENDYDMSMDYVKAKIKETFIEFKNMELDLFFIDED